MPARAVLELLDAFDARGVHAVVSGGWAIDALLGEQHRPHVDLDVWVEAADTEALVVALVETGVDRLHPWPGDRPWNFVVHDGERRRVDLHLYERLDDGRLRYGSAASPSHFTEPDLAGAGSIAGREVCCESATFALANHTGYEPRAVDRDDVARLCDRFGLERPAPFR